MAKSKAGLPDGFQINLERPAELGDYLDEGFEQEAVRAIVAKQRPAVVPVVPTPEPAQPHAAVARRQVAPQPRLISNDPLPVAERNDVLNLAEARRRAAPKIHVQKRPERMQFNLRPETQKMFAEIVEFVQRYSLQDDAKASEILDALVSILHQSRDELAFNDVPRRGKWGTPTARAFPTALGNAFARAIAASYSKAGRGEE